MSGHSKWSTIKHKKAATDKKRGKLFSKLSRAIIVAAREGGGDPDANHALATAIQKARDYSMPKDNIERAIARGAGGADTDAYETVVYEGYGPGGSALIIEALTDNRNRTATNVRTAVSKNGGNLGAPGAVSHAFDRLGQIIYAAKAGDPDTVFEAALEAGAADVESSDDGHEIWTAMDELHEVAKALEAKLGAPDTVKLAWRPQTTVTVGEGEAGTLMKLLDALDDDDDVQTVWGNYDVPDDVMEKLG